MPELILDLDDADGGLCNAKYLEMALAPNPSFIPISHKTNRGGEDGVVVPCRNIGGDASTVKSQSHGNERQSQGEPFSNEQVGTTIALGWPCGRHCSRFRNLEGHEL